MSPTCQLQAMAVWIDSTLAVSTSPPLWIIAAQSAGDRAALIEAGRDVITVDVGSDGPGAVRALIGALA